MTERADTATFGCADTSGAAVDGADHDSGEAAGAAGRAGAESVAGRVAVVTDSTADLPSSLAGAVRVVPLEVRLGDRVVRDGVDIGPGELSAAIADRRLDVQTSRPTPEAFAGTYRELLAEGASAVVSVHLSRELSGTWEAARLAAEQVDPDRVRVVDSRAMGMGLGFAVLAADRAAAEGAEPAEVEEAAAAVAARCRVIFCVDELDRLRRGGRIGAAAAVLGTVLAVKPLLHLVDGRITALEKVRTSARATQRLVEHAVAAAGGEADVAVHHLGVPERAEELADRLAERLPRSPRPVVSEISAVIGAHVGNGALGVVVVPRG
ncbi:DegV family protein [Pseudonocardia yuanmonensis]|uniref:DegV family protein n=1 Tax=Pseudonocardia yuanmonensis TaxID=1095914 RepID=A0ABP8W1Z9_9PSEU